MSIEFSIASRAESTFVTEGPLTNSRPATRFDVLVIGGGALGCAVAWEAASRGLGTALLERDDFGAATSANSLGIIHGGLRYLQKMNLRRSRMSARERSVFLRIAPHLVSPLECVVPTVKSLKRGRMAFAAGLGLNRLVTAGLNKGLADGQRLRGGGLLGRTELERRAPGMDLSDVTGAARWYDGYMVSGERLALAFALSARHRGATVRNHCAVEEFVIERGRVAGVRTRDTLDDTHSEYAARVIVDCRGVGMSDDGNPGLDSQHSIDFVKAVNIVVAGKGLACAVGAPVRDAQGAPIGGRLIFARPWDGDTVIGTWYFPHSPGCTTVLPPERDEILQATNSAFPEWKLAGDDILSVQVGYLPRNPGNSTENLPIERPIIMRPTTGDKPEGLWQLQTEKWTTVRLLAERMIDEIARSEGLSAEPSATRTETLYGAGQHALAGSHLDLLSELPRSQAARLLRHYGSCIGSLLDYVEYDPTLLEPVPAAEEWMRAELAYALDFELARSANDVIRRLMSGRIRPLSTEAVESVSRFMHAYEPRQVSSGFQTR
jgi:glycerol-3-phosphate dehydrogenase